MISMVKDGDTNRYKLFCMEFLYLKELILIVVYAAIRLLYMLSRTYLIS